MRQRNVSREPVQTPWHDRHETCAHFNVGYSTLIKWAREIGAVVKIGRINRFDWNRLERDLHDRMNQAI